MWVLTTLRGQEVAIARLPAVIGNAPDADVKLPHESVAARHARVSEGGTGGLRLEALDGAAVGVGGRKVERALVHDGDELVFGRVKLVLRNTAGGGRAPAAVTASASTPAAPPAPRVPAGEPVLSPRVAAPQAPAPAAEELTSRRKTLQFHKVEARSGLLHADLSQLPAGQRALLWLVVLAGAAGLAYGIARLVGLIK